MCLKNLRNSAIVIGLILSLQSCDLIKVKSDEEVTQKPIARVKNHFLYEDDLKGLVKPGINSTDSSELVDRFVNDWIRKQLLIDEATQKINVDEAEIERKILDYRYSLIGYEYQRYYIDNNLNTDVSDQEIETYYNENLDNFALKQNIIRGIYVKVPVEAPNTGKLKRMIRANKDDDIEELKAYCLSFATQYEINDSVWMVFEELVTNSPLADIPNKVQFLRKSSFVENADDDFLYYLKIEEYRISDDLSPLEFVKDQIVNIILNKRKVELARELEDNIYENAVTKNEFEVYK